MQHDHLVMPAPAEPTHFPFLSRASLFSRATPPRAGDRPPPEDTLADRVPTPGVLLASRLNVKQDADRAAGSGLAPGWPIMPAAR